MLEIPAVLFQNLKISKSQKFNTEQGLSQGSKGFDWTGWLSIAVTDCKGAYDGAKLGGKIASVFGPKGATSGAFLCGTIAGI